jgi:hypothetical protein
VCGAPVVMAGGGQGGVGSGLPPDDEHTRLVSGEKGVGGLLAAIFEAERTEPVIGLTCPPGDLEPGLKVLDVRELVGPDMLVYVIKGRRAERLLADGLPNGLEVYGGAVRVWWPGINKEDGDPHDHPLILLKHSSVRALERLQRELSPDEQDPTSTGLSIRERLRLVERDLHVERRQRSKAQARARELEVEVGRLRRRLHAYEGVPEDEEGVVGEELAAVDETPPGEEGEVSAERLDALILEQHEEALSPEDRERWPLCQYVYGPRFLRSIQAHRVPTPLKRVAWVCAMIACDRGSRLSGLEVHELISRQTKRQITREDGARGWRAVLQHRAGGPRIHFWILPDKTIEFDQVGKHDMSP